MPLDTSYVGHEFPAWKGTVDARWLMAYAAGLGHSDPAYFDTTRPEGIVSHPLFPICPEWALLTQPDTGRTGLGLPPDESLRGVHARHDLHLHRTVPAGAEVTVEARVVAVVRTRAGALLTVRFDGTSDDGPLWTSWMSSLYRGVEVTGPGTGEVPLPGLPDPAAAVPDTRSGTRAVPAGEPHVYSECGRLWNPIHTDLAVARGVALPGLILHGSATLAHGVDWVLDTLGARPEHVTRLGCSFRATVAVPGTIRPVLEAVGSADDGTLTAHFTVLNESGETAVRDAFLVVSTP
ncbi:MaoC family dehydratase N-terminal domain-containing protein [Streptacidiphilus sp. ASG 303]|uniref:MaoC family dehydratase n=1 Tax=Streptacidiphilus sp. ASG 303 TaxID=2896847 RepID=UPI001E2DA374|nr:MaoC/PaaZ C-terminal domain-containing protein [Streptacidiphilus sp. ASG 303]MCD0485434.1 MaoC family dehydratase N-terminal domain-containing protein [Streptacidiphilus sp. ASG 303]